MEKVGWVKLKVDGPAEGGMGRLQALEGLLLGITGKLALWRLLSDSQMPIGGADLAKLIERTERQLTAVESKRVEAAREAFSL